MATGLDFTVSWRTTAAILKLGRDWYHEHHHHDLSAPPTPTTATKQLQNCQQHHYPYHHHHHHHHLHNNNINNNNINNNNNIRHVWYYAFISKARGSCFHTANVVLHGNPICFWSVTGGKVLACVENVYMFTSSLRLQQESNVHERLK